MRFKVYESTYNRHGTEKAFVCSDQYGHDYWIPRSQVKVVERIEPKSEYEVPELIIDVPNWIIHKNCIPIFTLTELWLVR